jgi:hypothetical protein
MAIIRRHPSKSSGLVVSGIESKSMTNGGNPIVSPASGLVRRNRLQVVEVWIPSSLQRKLNPDQVVLRESRLDGRPNRFHFELYSAHAWDMIITGNLQASP